MDKNSGFLLKADARLILIIQIVVLRSKVIFRIDIAMLPGFGYNKRVQQRYAEGAGYLY
jgi:hypothetical protein